MILEEQLVESISKSASLKIDGKFPPARKIADSDDSTTVPRLDNSDDSTVPRLEDNHKDDYFFAKVRLLIPLIILLKNICYLCRYCFFYETST